GDHRDLHSFPTRRSSDLHWPRLVSQGLPEPAGGRPLWRRVLVSRSDELGKLAAEGSHPAPQLVARPVSGSLPPLGHRARPESARLLDHLRNGPRRPQGVDGIGVVALEEMLNPEPESCLTAEPPLTVASV